LHRIKAFSPSIDIGDGWYKAFCRRNPGITERTPQSLAQQRAAVTRKQIQEWMEQATATLDIEAPGALDDPRRVFNADESGFSIHAVSKRVLAEKGQSQVYQRASKSREQITVLVCAKL
jgi:hypothetical protein